MGSIGTAAGAPAPTHLAPAAARPRAPVAGRLLRRMLGIDPGEATFARRGFTGQGEARLRLERVGAAFLEGYHAALEQGGGTDALPAALEPTPAELRGFAYEGAAMALALLDFLAPWRNRLGGFIGGGGAAHVYMLHVGAGWALARLRRPLRGVPAGMDPLLGWLAADGYGFHEGYFHPRRTVEAGGVPRRVAGYARRAFDQGVGRSLWFVHGARAEPIAAAVARFAPERRGDLWSGVGLACAYAGGGEPGTAHALAAAGHLPALAQGAAFAARARQRAGNPAAHTDAACRLFCGAGAGQAAGVAELASRALPPDGAVPAYEAWRQRIQHHFALTAAA